MTSVQETVSSSEKQIQEESTDYESLFNNPLWNTSPDLTQPASETKGKTPLSDPSQHELIKSYL